MLAAGTVLCAMAIDARWGEPRAAWHPVVAIGTYLRAAGRRLPVGPPAGAMAAGALAWWLGALVVGALGIALDLAMAWGAAGGAPSAMPSSGWTPFAWPSPAPSFSGWASAAIAMLAGGWVLKTMLAWSMLRDEVLAVETALARDGLDVGRARLSRLVSRDVSALSADEVRESAIESLAENLNDSVVAPLCWFACLGFAGACVYRYANTADAMWGYRGRWEWAGKWAARADDVLSWVPARLCALALGGCGRLRHWRRLPAQARLTPSPNGGWPMAAMALLLDVRLGKPGAYVLNAGARAPQAADLHRAVAVAGAAVRATVLAVVVVMVVMAIAARGG
ncbi:MAG: adenosylcobinamide-phosphate synthase CbiB [Burkholderiaceae bacterium]